MRWFLFPIVILVSGATAYAADLGKAVDFKRTFDSAMDRIGFDDRPTSTSPKCTSGGVALTCNMRIGTTMGVVIGTDGEMARDFMLVKTGHGEATAWINTMTTFIALFEPGASPVEVRKALAVLTSPLAAGKQEFSTSHDMTTAHLTMNAHPAMGVVFTIEPRSK